MKTILNISIIALMIGCVISCFLVSVAVIIGNYNLLGGSLAFIFLSLPFMLMLLSFKEGVY